MYDPDDSGEAYIPPLKTYLDNVEVYDAALGGLVPAWKSLIFHGAVLRNKMQRADSASDVSAAAQKGALSSQPKLAPPLVADSAKAKDEAKMRRVLDTIGQLEKRLDVLEERKRQAQEADECTRRAEAALALAEEIAESAPATILDALSPAPKQRLN